MLRNLSNAASAAQDIEIAHIHFAPQKSLLDRLGEVAATVSTAMERRRQRLALLELDNRLLRDVGLLRADVWQECSKSIWQR